jgi:WD40 repeat protein
VIGYAEVSIIDVASQRKIATRELEPDGSGLAFSADGTSVAMASSGHGFAIFDATLRPRRTLTTLEQFSSVEHAAFSPDGKWIAAGIGGPNPALAVWPVGEGGGVTLDRTDVTYGPQPTAFSADSQRLASFARGNELRIWSTTSWAEERKWTLPGTGRDLAFAPQGSRLAIASENEAAIWDTRTGTKLFTLISSGSDEMQQIAWSPDGARVVAVADDGVLRFWNAVDGRLQASLCLFESGRDWLLVTPDGRLDGSQNALGRFVAWRVGGSLRTAG